MRKLIAVLLLVGCSGADADHTWSGSVETLSNGAVRVTNPAAGAWTDASAWRLIPELQIGEAEGADADMFGSISGLEVDADGRIYVLDRQVNELRIFGRDGAHVRSVGRGGRGPGEFVAANGLLWLADDSLLIVDQRGGRYSILTRDGDFVRSVPRTLGFYGWAFAGRVAGARIYENAFLGTGPDPAPALIGTPLRGAFLEGDDAPAAGAAMDTIPLPAPAVTFPEPFIASAGGSRMVMGVPFAPRPFHYLDDDGGIWHGHGGEFRLVRSTLAGDTLVEIIVDAESARVTPGDLEEWERSPGVVRFREMGGRPDMSRIPPTKPYLDSVYRAPDGHIWVSVPSAPDETVFAILDPDGRYLGRQRLEGIRRLGWVPPVVRNGRLYLAVEDELEVPAVHVYRIER